MTPWLKCIDEAKGKDPLLEMHAGPTGAHEGERALMGKILQMGISWPSIQLTSSLCR